MEPKRKTLSLYHLLYVLKFPKPLDLATNIELTMKTVLLLLTSEMALLLKVTSTLPWTLLLLYVLKLYFTVETTCTLFQLPLTINTLEMVSLLEVLLTVCLLSVLMEMICSLFTLPLRKLVDLLSKNKDLSSSRLFLTVLEITLPLTSLKDIETKRKWKNGMNWLLSSLALSNV